MRPNMPALLSLGMVLVLAAGLGTFQYTHALEAEAASARAALEAFGRSVDVPVAAHDIAPGSTLTAADFTTLRVPAAHLPTNALRELPALPEGRSFLALSELKAGALLLTTSLGESGGSASFGFALSPDGRAFAVLVENLRNFPDRARVGDRVDLYWTRDIGGGSTETRLLGSALRILALPPPAQEVDSLPDSWASQSHLPDGGQARGQLVLEGMAVEVARFIAAEQKGRFHIAPATGQLDAASGQWVVGPGDLATLPLAIRAAGGGGSGPPLPFAASPPATCQTAVIRAGTRAMMEIPC